MAYGKVDFSNEDEISKLKKEMGTLIKKARVNKNIRQFDFVIKYGVRQGRISDIENGKVEILVSELIKLSKILDEPIINLLPEWSISREDEQPRTAEMEELIHQARKLPAEKISDFIEQIKAVVRNTKISN
jgi:transcriptional regulator with XRE-family HTH domain